AGRSRLTATGGEATGGEAAGAAGAAARRKTCPQRVQRPVLPSADAGTWRVIPHRGHGQTADDMVHPHRRVLTYRRLRLLSRTGGRASRGERPEWAGGGGGQGAPGLTFQSSPLAQSDHAAAVVGRIRPEPNEAARVKMCEDAFTAEGLAHVLRRPDRS